jgi:hypothetical protein
MAEMGAVRLIQVFEQAFELIGMKGACGQGNLSWRFEAGMENGQEHQSCPGDPATHPANHRGKISKDRGLPERMCPAIVVAGNYQPPGDD